MKKIVAVNCSPRASWNTATLVREAAEGARAEGAEVEVIDLYKLGKFTGCVSCFGCMRAPSEGKCVVKDALAPVLASIREADGVILGSPNYLSEMTAGFRALYERLVFQSLTYNLEKPTTNERPIPVLLIMTTNCPEEFYGRVGYKRLLRGYQRTLGTHVGPTKVLTAGNTLQVSDYSKYNWTMFDPAAKKERHETVFPKKKKRAYTLGAQMVKKGW